MRNHGVEPSRRWELMREQLMAMKTIWAEDEAEFHGQFVDFDPIWLWPKPVQVPHPPVLIGGMGERSLRLSAEQGDGWMPVVGELPEFQAQLSRLQDLRERYGGADFEVTAILEESAPHRGRLARCAELGVRRCVMVAPIENLSVLEAFLERYLQAAERVDD
jgi:alkanesulfonate monooxygenase SsuD/methylene tetrahydromethanopterin reductase-like flavin-dependent oxidoreductase (luciferase family)